MALIVENGTKPAGANSYVTLAEADAYHAMYGNSDWPQASFADPLNPTQEETDAEAARAALLEPLLITGTRSVDLLYGATYASVIQPNSTQSLLFPRYSFYDRFGRFIAQNVIPVPLKDAVCEVALMALNGDDVLPLPDAESGVQSQSVTVGDVATAVTYRFKPMSETYPGFNTVDKVLWPILKEPSGNVRFGL